MDDIQQFNNDSSQITTTSGLTVTSSQDIQSNYNLNYLPSTSHVISDNSLHRIEVDLFSNSDRDSIDSIDLIMKKLTIYRIRTLWKQRMLNILQ